MPFQTRAVGISYYAGITLWQMDLTRVTIHRTVRPHSGTTYPKG